MGGGGGGPSTGVNAAGGTDTGNLGGGSGGIGAIFIHKILPKRVGYWARASSGLLRKIGHCVPSMLM